MALNCYSKVVEVAICRLFFFNAVRLVRLGKGCCALFRVATGCSRVLGNRSALEKVVKAVLICYTSRLWHITARF